MSNTEHDNDVLTISKKSGTLSTKKPIQLDEKPVERPRTGFEKSSQTNWKILIVDDEKDVHMITRLVLHSFQFEGRTVDFLDAYSGEEARELLQQHPDTAIVLLDVVMETTHAGLELVKFIRYEMNNPFMRIILRTGQPGKAPERDVVTGYEIDDYKTKIELTSDKLFVTVMASLRTYSAMMMIESLRQNLEKKVNERTAELRQQKEKLEVLYQEKNEFTESAAHNLKEPLSGTVSLLNSIVDAPPQTPVERFFGRLQTVRYALLKIRNTLLNFIDMNIIDSDKMEIVKEEFDLPFLVGKIVEDHYVPAQQKQITLHFNQHAESTHIKTDMSILRQILENLISNAIKFSDPEKYVFIKTTPHESKIRIEVQDEGPGLTEDDLHRIFGKFARLSARPTGGEYSTGLGLAIVKRLTELLGGRVWAESDGPGQGSRFIVELERGL